MERDFHGLHNGISFTGFLIKASVNMIYSFFSQQTIFAFESNQNQIESLINEKEIDDGEWEARRFVIALCNTYLFK